MIYYTAQPISTADKYYLNTGLEQEDELPKVLFKCKEKYLNIGLSNFTSETFQIYNIGIKHKYLRRHKESLEILCIHDGDCHGFSIKDFHLDDKGNLIWHPGQIVLPGDDRSERKIQLLMQLLEYELNSLGNNSFINLEKHEFESDDDAKLWFEMEYNL